MEKGGRRKAEGWMVYYADLIKPYKFIAGGELRGKIASSTYSLVGVRGAEGAEGREGRGERGGGRKQGREGRRSKEEGRGGTRREGRGRREVRLGGS